MPWFTTWTLGASATASSTDNPSAVLAGVEVQRIAALPLARGTKASHSASSIELLMTGRALSSAKPGPAPK